MSDILFSKGSELEPDDYVGAQGYTAQSDCGFDQAIDLAREQARTKLVSIADDSGYLGYTHVSEQVNVTGTFVIVTITGQPVPSDSRRYMYIQP